MTVARRQHIVKNRAQIYGAIVNSLFPAAVRQQMYQETKQNQERQAAEKNFCTKPNPEKEDPVERKSNVNLYPETTILFADLSCFTIWSSTRNPMKYLSCSSHFMPHLTRLRNGAKSLRRKQLVTGKRVIANSSRDFPLTRLTFQRLLHSRLRRRYWDSRMPARSYRCHGEVC